MLDESAQWFFIGLLVALVHPVVEYFVHRKDKLCYHCGRPYKDGGDAS